MARELSAAPRHQVAAAAAVAMTALTLAVGHLFETTTFDMVTTAAAVWLFVRVMRSEPQRWTPWIAAGVLTGVAMEIKILAATLLVCCLLGVVICGPRSRLLSPRLWTAVAIALLMAAPNLVWQAVHGFPMLQIAANIAGGGSTSSTPRVALVPSVLLAVGPVVSIVLIVGLIVLLRSDRRGTDGWLAAGFLIFIAFLLITGGILLPGWTRSGGVGRRCRAGAGLGVPRAAVAAGAGGRVDPHLGGQHNAADAAGGSSRWTRVHDRDRAQSGSGGRGGMAGVRRSGRGGRGEHSRGAARRHHRVGSELSAGGGARCAPARERSDDARRVFRSQRLLVLGATPGIGHRCHRHRELLPGRTCDRVRALQGGGHAPDAARR